MLRLIVILFSVFGWASTVFAYTPPIGIPDPGMWGATHPIDGVAPSTATKCSGWPTAQAAGCYYIDNTSPQATDTSNSYGYPDKPRLTIPTTYPAGSYVELHGGPYTGTVALTLQGTVDNPIWFRGTVAAMPTITGSMTISGAYGIFENLDFNGGNSGCITLIGLTTNNIGIRNSKFRNRTWINNTSGIGTSPTQNGIIKDIVIYNNEFTELGDDPTTWDTLDHDFHGVAPSLWGRTAPTEVHHIWILNNTFSRVGGNGVQVIAGQTFDLYTQLHHIYIGKNVGHSNRQSSFWSKMASDVIMSQNTAYDGRNHGAQPGGGIGYQYNPHNLWIIFNNIYDCTHGIRQSDSGTTETEHNVYIIGNLIHDITMEGTDVTNQYKEGQGISLWQGLQNRYVVNNTIYNSHGGINSVQLGDAELYGNIIYGISSTDDYHITTLNNTSRLLFSHNFYGGTGRVSWNGYHYTGVSAIIAGTGQGANSYEGNPLFVSPLTNDFRVATYSPAIGMSSKHSSYDTFQTLYGLNIAVDYNGRSRPSGAWTAGAFEYTQIPTGTHYPGNGKHGVGTMTIIH